MRANVRLVEETDGVAYRLDRAADPVAIAEVYRSVGWERMASDPERLREALLACTEVISAWEGEVAVGVARLLTDQHFHAIILGVAVRPDRQGKGIGSRLVRNLVALYPDAQYHLWTRNRRFSFYGRLGFEMDDAAMLRPPDRRGER
jgi:predicted N-acetyltransferase YhbS